MANDEMFTPYWVFEALDLKFDIDVASSHNPHVVECAWKKYTIDEDGLAQDWNGLVWMNPPFSKVTPWIEKWLDHANGLCLVPLSSNGRWVNTLWESDAKLVYLPPNMKFIGGEDGKMISHRWRCALWAIGEQAIQALDESKIGKMR